MLQYANEFTCTVDDSKKTVVIHFRQNEPIPISDEDGEVKVEIIKNNISSIVVDVDGARALSALINQVLEQSDA